MTYEHPEEVEGHLDGEQAEREARDEFYLRLNAALAQGKRDAQAAASRAALLDSYRRKV